jgi:hypothetical protein
VNAAQPAVAVLLDGRAHMVWKRHCVFVLTMIAGCATVHRRGEFERALAARTPVDLQCPRLRFGSPRGAALSSRERTFLSTSAPRDAAGASSTLHARVDTNQSPGAVLIPHWTRTLDRFVVRNHDGA